MKGAQNSYMMPQTTYIIDAAFEAAHVCVQVVIVLPNAHIRVSNLCSSFEESAHLKRVECERIERSFW